MRYAKHRKAGAWRKRKGTPVFRGRPRVSKLLRRRRK